MYCQKLQDIMHAKWQQHILNESGQLYSFVWGLGLVVLKCSYGDYQFEYGFLAKSIEQRQWKVHACITRAFDLMIWIRGRWAWGLVSYET